MKKLIINLAVLCLTVFVYGQEDTAQTIVASSKTYYLGLGASKTMGLGATFRMWGKKYGFNTSFLPILDKNENMFFSVSLSPMVKLKETKRTTIYAFNGNHYIYRTDYRSISHYEVDPNNYYYDYYEEQKYYRSIFNIGFGVGIEVHINNITLGTNVSYVSVFEYKAHTSIMPGCGIFLFYKL